MNQNRIVGRMLIVLALLLSLSACRGSSTADSTAPAAGVNVADQLSITTLKGYQDDYHYWHLVGLVVNNSAQAVSDVQIEVTIFDAAGAELHKAGVYAMLSELAAGESSPFELWVYEPLPTLDHYRAAVVAASLTDLQRAALEITNLTQAVDMYNVINLSGEAINQGTLPVTLHSLAATLYDTDGNLVSAGSVAVVKNHLEPGAHSPFRIELHLPTSLLASVARYEFHPNVVVTGPKPAYDLAFSNFNNYLDASGNFHLFGMLTNHSSANLSLRLVAGIYDGEGRVLDAAAMKLPISCLPPGESVPFDFDNWGPMSLTGDGYAKATEYSVQVDPYWTQEAASGPVVLSTREDGNTFATGIARFFGEVVNDSGQELSGATIYVALYQRGTDTLIATDATWIFDRIAKGAAAPYEIIISVPAGFDSTNMEYVLSARGELP